ncbi:hypothetical protein M422DRAFT_241132 [Sphaerobolus stellatus SS14]|nr:hypothetical protein M422DRAFT_241132 [Sphaerobolus stellatus SS14]
MSSPTPASASNASQEAANEAIQELLLTLKDGGRSCILAQLITATISSIAFLVTWQALPPSRFIWPIFYIPLASIYVNSLLVSLNAREGLRRQMCVIYTTKFSMFDVDGIDLLKKSGADFPMVPIPKIRTKLFGTTVSESSGA